MKKIEYKTAQMKLIETKLREDVEEIIRVRYVDENRSLGSISSELHISQVTLQDWLKRAGIYSRKLKI